MDAHDMRKQAADAVAIADVPPQIEDESFTETSKEDSTGEEASNEASRILRLSNPPDAGYGNSLSSEDASNEGYGNPPAEPTEAAPADETAPADEAPPPF